MPESKEVDGKNGYWLNVDGLNIWMGDHAFATKPPTPGTPNEPEENKKTEVKVSRDRPLDRE